MKRVLAIMLVLMMALPCLPPVGEDVVPGVMAEGLIPDHINNTIYLHSDKNVYSYYMNTLANDPNSTEYHTRTYSRFHARKDGWTYNLKGSAEELDALEEPLYFDENGTFKGQIHMEVTSSSKPDSFEFGFRIDGTYTVGAIIAYQSNNIYDFEFSIPVNQATSSVYLIIYYSIAIPGTELDMKVYMDGSSFIDIPLIEGPQLDEREKMLLTYSKLFYHMYVTEERPVQDDTIGWMDIERGKDSQIDIETFGSDQSGFIVSMYPSPSSKMDMNKNYPILVELFVKLEQQDPIYGSVDFMWEAWLQVDGVNLGYGYIYESISVNLIKRIIIPVYAENANITTSSSVKSLVQYRVTNALPALHTKVTFLCVKDFPSGIMFPMMNSLDASLDIQDDKEKGKLTLSVDAKSPFGEEYLQEDTITLQIKGPTMAERLDGPEREMGGDLWVWTWDYGKDKAETGSYEFQFRVKDIQGNYLFDFVDYNLTTTAKPYDFILESIWDIMGLAGTAIAGIVGYFLFYRKHKRFKRHARHIDEASVTLSGSYFNRAMKLQEIKNEFHKDLSDKKLSDNQGLVLDRKIDDGLTKTRVASIQKRFSDLPENLQDLIGYILKDGRITRQEMDFLEDELTHVEYLTSDDRDVIIQRVKDWMETE